MSAVRRSLRALGVVLAAVFVAALVGPLPGAAVTLGLGAVMPRWRRVHGAARARRTLQTDLPDLIDLFVGLVGAGVTARQAFAVASERGPPSWRPAVAAVVAAQRDGVRFADALDTLTLMAGDVARPFAGELASAERYGHPLAPVLERLSAQGSALRRREAEIAARQLPVRLSFPLVCCTLPSFVLLTIAPLLAGAFSSISLSGGQS